MRRTLASTLILGALALAACGDDSGGTTKDAALPIDGSTVVDAAAIQDARPIDARAADAGRVDASGMVVNPPSDAGMGKVACGNGASAMTCDQATQECCITQVGMAI